ncbi:unnamed protein product [Calypogeia fissa]
MPNGQPEHSDQAQHPHKGGPETDIAQSRGGPVGTPAARVASGGPSGEGHKLPKPGHTSKVGAIFVAVSKSTQTNGPGGGGSKRSRSREGHRESNEKMQFK